MNSKDDVVEYTKTLTVSLRGHTGTTAGGGPRHLPLTLPTYQLPTDLLAYLPTCLPTTQVKREGKCSK